VVWSIQNEELGCPLLPKKKSINRHVFGKSG